jgi:hypothetical protein
VVSGFIKNKGNFVFVETEIERNVTFTYAVSLSHSDINVSAEYNEQQYYIQKRTYRCEDVHEPLSTDKEGAEK